MNTQPDLFEGDFNLAITEQPSLPTMDEIAERREAVAKEANRQISFLESPKTTHLVDPHSQAGHYKNNSVKAIPHSILYPMEGFAGFYLSPQDNGHLLKHTKTVKSVKPLKKLRAYLRATDSFAHERGRY